MLILHFRRGGGAQYMYLVGEPLCCAVAQAIPFLVIDVSEHSRHQ